VETISKTEILKKPRIVLIQPPFIQLNSPYPAPYYLKSFLEQRGYSVKVFDHSISLFESIFSRSGLNRIFDAVLSERRYKNGKNYSGNEISERFLSEKELWLASIERLVSFLRGRDREWSHLLALANGCFPGGPRTDAFLTRGNGNLSADEAGIFATKLIDDLADFITHTLDRGFSLIRYMPEIGASLKNGFRNFPDIQKGYIMNEFYRPLLKAEWENLKKDNFCRSDSGSGDGMLLVGITIPFPGCLSGAMICAESAKKQFGSAVRTVAGGGYVNTELRFLDTPEIFDYFDYLSFDRGYGSLLSIVKYIDAGENHAEVLYKTMYRFEGKVIASPGISSDNEARQERENISREMSSLEDEAVKTVFPDYSAVDFGQYLYPVDDANPMHRLWSDGHWLKAYLAHGCYWHSCAFCDVTLDYIKSFIPVETSALFLHLKNQAEKTGVRGIHFCDEAIPVSSLVEFALLNREAGLPLCFWGNIRFERDFDSDTAAALAAGGLIGVSAGLELATEKGLKRLGKGIDTENAVRACAAFKEAGVLVHAYLIYGYWDEDEEELIDSAETLRQFFAGGLLDSAFWHKFVLTCHSRIYAGKQRGLYPALKVTDDLKTGESVFALNDLSFEGEENFDKYAEGLEKLLGAWMSGETEIPVQAAFPFRVKTPSLSPHFVTALLDKYARERDRCRASIPAKGSRALFLGSLPRRGGKNSLLLWRWRLAEHKLRISDDKAEKLAILLETASRGKGMDSAEFYQSITEITGKTKADSIWKELRESGLVVLT